MILLLSLIRWIHRLHTEVETQDEIVEIQTDTQTIADGQIPQEAAYLELSTRLILIVAQRPDISCVDEQGTAELPEQVCAILQVQVELQVTRLCDEVDLPVLILVTARAQTSHTPASHAVGTTREITLLERQDPTVTIRTGDAESEVEHQLIFAQPAQQLLGEVEVTLHILGIGDAEEHILLVLVHLGLKDARREVQQVTRRLHVRLQRIAAVVVRIAEAHLHDKEVLVVLAQDGVRVRRIVQILFLEGLTDPGHEHIVQVYQVDTITVMMVLVSPVISPHT